MQLQTDESLRVVITLEPDNYKHIYTVNADGEKHGVEYAYFPNSNLYFSISHYFHGRISAPILYFRPDGSIDHIIDYGAPRVMHPTLDDFTAYSAVKELT